MAAQHRELVPHRFNVAGDITGIGQAGDRSVSCSAPPAIMTGGRGYCTGFGSRIASSTWKYQL